MREGHVHEVEIWRSVAHRARHQGIPATDPLGRRAGLQFCSTPGQWWGQPMVQHTNGGANCAATDASAGEVQEACSRECRRLAQSEH